jgi:pimeloyl-ACP methyl ester carboxylesterase
VRGGAVAADPASAQDARMKAMISCLLVLAACGSTPPAKPTTPTEPGSDPRAVVEGKTQAPDGVELHYDVRGKGDTALVFVHCWSCDRTYWKHQVDELAGDYRVVTLDLGGHGRSGDSRTAWTIASLGGDVRAVIEALDLKRVIVIGHSMGGPVALDVARRLPRRVVGVVCADTLHDAERKMPEEMRASMLKGFETDFTGTMREGMKSMFRPDADPAVVEWVTSRALTAKPAVALPLMRELSALELGPMLAAAKVPIRCINAAPAGPMAPPTNLEGNRKHADFDAVLIDDVGHFLQLEKPAEFNARLREVLATWK